MRLFGLRKIIFFLVFFYCCNLSWGQRQTFSKPIIDSEAIVSWPSIGDGDPLISGDGLYASYWIKNRPVGGRTLVVQSIDRSWKKEYLNADHGFFSANSKTFVFFRKDSLYFVSLGTEQFDYIANVVSYRPSSQKDAEWLGIQLKGSLGEFILKSLSTNERKVFHDVASYSDILKGSGFLLETIHRQGDSFLHQLQWCDFSSNQLQTMWSSEDSLLAFNTFSYDSAVKQLVFTFYKQDTFSIWYYRMGENHSVEILKDRVDKFPEWSISSAAQFADDGRHIICEISQPIDISKFKSYPVSIDIYSYRDSILQYNQTTDLFAKSQLVVDVTDPKKTVLLNEGERILASNDSFMVISNRKEPIRYNNYAWWPSLKNSRRWLVSLQDGGRTELPSQLNNCEFYSSPKSRYFIYIDRDGSGYFSYDCYSGTLKNISCAIPEKWLPGIAGYLSDGKEILVNDLYDIWRLDIMGEHAPVNITKSYGHQHNIEFRIIGGDINRKYNDNEDVLLVAFQTTTKYNGFYHINLSHNTVPNSLTMAPYAFYRTHNQTPANTYRYDEGVKPVKAAHADVWIVKRQTAATAPDYCITRDFKNFEAFTDVHPEKNYNWLTSELVTYKQLDGVVGRGILYKPADFDSTKKYPVIFNYYEHISSRVYEFPEPEFATGNIDVPWFVSRGYLVFTPDISYEDATISGKVTGDYAVNAVVGAAKYLAKRPYIDKDKMGIQGHSFGGGETLYLITHSSVFAAACAAAPAFSDLLSGSLSVVRGNKEHLVDFSWIAENGQQRISATPWQRMDLYQKASPLLRADKVTTPLLLMHNQGDENVEWNQGMMMYMALRRLQKPVWMLQYDGRDYHTVWGKNDPVDYTTRMTQFFNYYLKGALPPKWMTDGIPRRLKGLDNGFELDDSGKKP